MPVRAPALADYNELKRNPVKVVFVSIFDQDCYDFALLQCAGIAKVHFAVDLAEGRVPSARRIKAGLHVGQDRAARIHDHLTAVVNAPREHSRRTA